MNRQPADRWGGGGRDAYLTSLLLPYRGHNRILGYCSSLTEVRTASSTTAPLSASHPRENGRGWTSLQFGKIAQTLRTFFAGANLEIFKGTVSHDKYLFLKAL